MEIKMGMKFSCFACNRTIEVTEKTLLKCWDGMYLTCPNCKRSISIESYESRGKICE